MSTIRKQLSVNSFKIIFFTILAFETNKKPLSNTSSFLRRVQHSSFFHSIQRVDVVNKDIFRRAKLLNMFDSRPFLTNILSCLHYPRGRRSEGRTRRYFPCSTLNSTTYKIGMHRQRLTNFLVDQKINEKFNSIYNNKNLGHILYFVLPKVENIFEEPTRIFRR